MQVAARKYTSHCPRGSARHSKDVNHGANEGVPTQADPCLRVANGREKRYFTRACCDQLFDDDWRVLACDEKTTQRFDEPKVFWEVVAIPAG